jgi:hypothetical protein
MLTPVEWPGNRVSGTNRHAKGDSPAIAIDEKVLGPEHPGLATDLNNLAGLYAGC